LIVKAFFMTSPFQGTSVSGPLSIGPTSSTSALLGQAPSSLHFTSVTQACLYI